MLKKSSSRQKKSTIKTVLSSFDSYRRRGRCSTTQANRVSATCSLPADDSKFDIHVGETALLRGESSGKDPVYSRELDDKCMEFSQLQLDDEYELKEDPLSSLLWGARSPLAKCDDVQKLAWLKSQLISENQEFVTPFGKRHLVYADHTASGQSVAFIEDFIARYLLPFYGNTHTEDSYVGGRTSKMMKQAEDYMKEKLGGSNDDALIMCGWGCTAAIKQLQEVMGITMPSDMRARMIDVMQASSEERWLVFTGPCEHHSNLLSWRQSLAEVIEIPANEEGEIDMGKLEAALQEAEASGRRQKMGAFSACSNVTGVLTDTRAIARLLHKYSAFACFDFAARAPHLQVEMRSSQMDGYDAIVMSPHKLLGGPGTPGLLLMQKNLYKIGMHPPSTCGGGTVAYVNGFNEEDTLYYKRIEEREEGGTPPIVGKVRCALAFWLKEAMGIPMIKQRETLYLSKVIKRLSRHPNIQILGNDPSSSRVPIFSFLIHTSCRPSKIEQQNQQGGFHDIIPFKLSLHGRFVVKLLNDLLGIQARGGCSCAGPYGYLLLGVGRNLSLAIRSDIQMGYEGLKPGWARVSLCYSMTEEEVEYIISAIELLGDYGRRFLALYDFDWHSGNWTYAHANALQMLCKDTREQLHRGNGVTIPALPENNPPRWGQRHRFRQILQLAKALSHLLPKCPQRKPIPTGINPNWLLFYV